MIMIWRIRDLFRKKRCISDYVSVTITEVGRYTPRIATGEYLDTLCSLMGLPRSRVAPYLWYPTMFVDMDERVEC